MIFTRRLKSILLFLDAVYKFSFLLFYTQRLKSRFLSVESTDHPRTEYTDTPLCSCDLDLDPMNLIYEPDLDIQKMMHQRTKNKLSRSRLSKVGALQINRQVLTGAVLDRIFINY